MVGNIAYFLFIVLVSFTSITYLSEAQDTSPRKVTAMYVFGDSLVDVGNNNHLELSLAKANFPHNGVDYPTGKATGRFSNGKNAADFIGKHLIISLVYLWKLHVHLVFDHFSGMQLKNLDCQQPHHISP